MAQASQRRDVMGLGVSWRNSGGTASSSPDHHHTTPCMFSCPISSGYIKGFSKDPGFGGRQWSSRPRAVDSPSFFLPRPRLPPSSEGCALHFMPFDTCLPRSAPGAPLLPPLPQQPPSLVLTRARSSQSLSYGPTGPWSPGPCPLCFLPPASLSPALPRCPVPSLVSLCICLSASFLSLPLPSHHGN